MTGAWSVGRGAWGLTLLGAVLALFAVLTAVALESGDVVVVATYDLHGERRETRAWIAEADGALWIEAANPDRLFYRDILAGSAVEIERDGVVGRFTAEPAANPAGHRKIRRLLRAKYGWKDAWIGLLADTSRSIGIQLHEATDGT